MASLLNLPADPATTHDTAGLAGFPAVDEFAPAGDPVYAPVGGKIVYVHTIPWDAGKRVGGVTAYLQGDNGKTYFLTHMAGDVPTGRVAAGQQIGSVSAVPGNAWQPHVHEGIHQGIYEPGQSSSQTSTVTASVPAAVAPPTATVPTSQPGLSAQTQALLEALLASHPANQPSVTPSITPLTHALAPAVAAPVGRLAAPAPLTLSGPTVVAPSLLG